MVQKDFTQTSSDNFQYSEAIPWHQEGDDVYEYWDRDITDHRHQTDKPNASHSSSLRNISSSCPDPEKRLQFLLDMENARNQLVLFRQEMNGLATQISGISEDLHESKNRVYEIEQDLTETQEDNVNLQVLLERAVRHQKESDIFATQAIRNIHSDLNLVVVKNSQLQERLSSIEHMQKEHQGNLHETVSRLREYVDMLEQAQDTILLLQEPISKRYTSLILESDSNSMSTQDLGLDSRRTSETSSYITEGDDTGTPTRKESQTTQQQPTKRSSFITLRPRIVSSPLLPPQKELTFLQSQPYPHYEKQQYHHRHQNIHKRNPLEQQRPKRHYSSNPLASKSQQGLLLLLND